MDNPHHVLGLLLQPSISHLPADIIIVYLQAILKIFSCWTFDLADHWSDSQLPRVKERVNAALEMLGSFASHADIETQERVK